MDFYIVLGVERGAARGRHQAGLQAPRAAVASGHQSGRPRGGGALPAGARRLRDVDRSGSAAALRRRPDRRDAPQDDAATFGFAGFDFSNRVHAERTTTFGELFEEVLSKRAPRAGRRRRTRRRHSRAHHADVRRSVARRAADGDRDAAGRVPRVRRQRLSARRRNTLRVVRGHRAPCDRCAGTWCSRRPARRAAGKAG